MKKANNISYKKIVLFIDIIVIIIMIGTHIIFNNNKANNKDNNKEEFDVEEFNNKYFSNMNTYVFKNFTLHFPQDVKYDTIDDNKFKLTTNEYNAIVEILEDDNKRILQYYLEYLDELKKDYPNIKKVSDIDVNGVSVLTYHINDDDNTILCYFSSTQPYVFQIQYNNLDKSYDETYLKEVLQQLLYSIYNPSNEKYDYRLIDFEI